MVEQHQDGRSVFRVFCPQAERVEIVGTFTGWHDRPIPMTLADDGWWSATLDLAPGDHEFQYLIDRREWRADYAAAGVRLNDFGTWVSLLTVTQPEVRIRLRPAHPAAHAA